MLQPVTTSQAQTVTLADPFQTVDRTRISPVQLVSSSASSQVFGKTESSLGHSDSPFSAANMPGTGVISPDQSTSPSTSSQLETLVTSPDLCLSQNKLMDHLNISGGDTEFYDIAPCSPKGSGSIDSQPRRKSRTKDEKICLVCGDKALGYNFNAMTCESCKAFFRRNALKSNTAACLFQGNCQIDTRTRRFCPHCRLVKCYTVGMKKDMILDDSERKARMQKVLENRKRKLKGSEKSDEDTKPVIKEEPCDSDMLPDQSDSSCQQQGETLLERFKQTSNVDVKSLCSPSVLGGNGYNKDPSMYRILSPAEYILFEDLGEAYKSTLGELLQDRIVDEESYNNCNDLINNSTVAVKRLIKFIKRLEDFQKLSQEDQIAALKSCVLSSLVLRSSCFYNIERDSWMTGSGEISTKILQKSTGYSELHEIHTNFCRALKEVVHDNKVLFSLIQVICIFNPDCKDVQGKCLMSNLQDKYIILLKHYLEWEFSYANAGSIFAKIMTIIADMKRTSDAHNAIILQANPSDIEPLMLEVLDLKGLVSGQH